MRALPLSRRPVFLAVFLSLCALIGATALPAQTLTFTGKVYSPFGPPVTGSTAAHGDPIPNILVFVQDPNSPLPVFSQGVTVPSAGQNGCEIQPNLVPAAVLGSALTDYSGTFIFNVAGALPATVNVVIQAGKWRRLYQYTPAQIAGFTTGSQVVLPPMSMPSSQSQGDLPHIAVVTGSADQIECIFPQIGVSASEVTDPLGGGSINFFSGNASSGEVVSSSSPTETQLVNPAATGAIPISNYDMVIFGCQSWAAGIADTDVGPYAANVEAFANEGGRVFGTHGEATWITTPPDWSGIAAFNLTGSDTEAASVTGQLSTGYAGEPTLAAWMTYIGALNAPAASLQFTLTDVFYNITAVNPPGETWVTIPGHSNTPAQFSFDTPVNSTGKPSAVVNFTNTQTNYALGDMRDSVVINVTDNSSTATLSGLTLTLQIPAGLSLTSLVDTTSGGAWTCTQTTPTATCVMGAPLTPGASDQVTFTFNIPQTATLGPNTIIGTLSNGGINQTNQCGRVLYNDYHVETPNGSISKADWSNGARCTNAASLTVAQKFLEYSLYNLSNFVAPVTSDTLDIQSPSSTAITNLISPIFYGQIIGDVNGQNALVSTTATACTTALEDCGTLQVYVDSLLVCTLENDNTGAACPNAGFSGQNSGSHSVYAVFTGDTDYAPSTSPTYTVIVQPDVTANTVSSSLNPSVSGNSVTFSSIVSAPYATPTGPVLFYSDGTLLGPGTLTGGTATYTTSALTVGSHAITTSYAATQNFDASAGGPITQVVQLPPATTALLLQSSLNPSTVGDSVTFTATLGLTAASAGAPSGNITFLDGTTVLGTGALSAQNVATFNTSALTVGTHSITASYAGNTYTLASTSAPLLQVVNPPPPDTFTMTVTPTSIVTTVGSTATASIAIVDQGIFKQPVNLTCTGVSAETTCTFISSVVPAGGGTTSLLYSSAPPHACSVSTASNDTLPRSTLPTLAAVGLGLFFLRKRRRLFGALTLVAALALLPLLNGCGAGCTDFGVKPGVYTFTITGTSTGSPTVTQTQAMTVTINP